MSFIMKMELAPSSDVHDEANPDSIFRNYREHLKPLVVQFNDQIPSYLQGCRLYRPALGSIQEKHSDVSLWKAPHPFEALGMITFIEFNSKENTALHLQRLNSNHIIKAIWSTPKSDWHTVKVSKTNRNLITVILNWTPPTSDDT